MSACRVEETNSLSGQEHRALLMQYRRLITGKLAETGGFIYLRVTNPCKCFLLSLSLFWTGLTLWGLLVQMEGLCSMLPFWVSVLFCATTQHTFWVKINICFVFGVLQPPPPEILNILDRSGFRGSEVCFRRGLAVKACLCDWWWSFYFFLLNTAELNRQKRNEKLGLESI